MKSEAGQMEAVCMIPMWLDWLECIVPMTDTDEETYTCARDLENPG
jgi:hypothetical protein